MTENSSQVDQEYRAMRQMVEDSDQVHAFLNTRIGQKLMKDIDSEVEAWTEKLKHIKTDDPAVKEIQEEIWKREKLKIWFNTVLLQGEAVLEAIQETDATLDF